MTRVAEPNRHSRRRPGCPQTGTVDRVTWWRGRVRATPGRPRGAEIDELFGPSRRHIHERKEWVAIAKVDDRLAGDDPIVDLPAGTVTLSLTRRTAHDIPGSEA
ncbi:hypothetical protein C8259_20915 [Nocardia nova]|uniref:Uncharacterized protein n=1 Tax=Nocardia nova TaxID=37330 RepID=A0A2T2YZS3_9NOCA|nr:hypothetical protein C8259_20915 [Nocardia nova]